MSSGTQDVESALIESVCERVRERVAPEEVAEAEAFVRQYYRRAPAADLSGREAVDLYGAALAHWTFGRDRAPRRGARARLQPDVRAARLAVAAHGDRDRLRRHAVPRGLGEHGAQPARARHPRARAPGGGRRVLHAHRDRPPGGRLRRARGRAARGAGAGARGGRGLAADARAHAGADRRADAGGHGRGRVRRGAGAARLGRRSPLHLPRLPRVRAHRERAEGRRGLGPGPVARRRRLVLGLRQAAAGRARAGPRTRFRW